MNADIIFVVSDGDVVEHGSHEELLEKGGKYSELWSKQIFVKPKEVKELDSGDSKGPASKVDEDQPNGSSTGGSGNAPDTTATKPSNGTTAEAKPPASGKLIRPVQAPKLITTDLPASGTNGTDAKNTKTPNGNGHKEVHQSKSP